VLHTTECSTACNERNNTHAAISTHATTSTHHPCHAIHMPPTSQTSSSHPIPSLASTLHYRICQPAHLEDRWQPIWQASQGHLAEAESEGHHQSTIRAPHQSTPPEHHQSTIRAPPEHHLSTIRAPSEHHQSTIRAPHQSTTRALHQSTIRASPVPHQLA
jgi:hypothetical protein